MRTSTNVYCNLNHISQAYGMRNLVMSICRLTKFTVVAKSKKITSSVEYMSHVSLHGSIFKKFVQFPQSPTRSRSPRPRNRRRRTATAAGPQSPQGAAAGAPGAAEQGSRRDGGGAAAAATTAPQQQQQRRRRRRQQSSSRMKESAANKV